MSGAFVHAAPLDVSNLMLEHFLANQPLPHAWYLMAIGQSYQTYAPGSFPDVESHLLPAFLDVYRHRIAMPTNPFCTASTAVPPTATGAPCQTEMASPP